MSTEFDFCAVIRRLADGGASDSEKIWIKGEFLEKICKQKKVFQARLDLGKLQKEKDREKYSLNDDEQNSQPSSGASDSRIDALLNELWEELHRPRRRKKGRNGNLPAVTDDESDEEMDDEREDHVSDIKGTAQRAESAKMRNAFAVALEGTNQTEEALRRYLWDTGTRFLLSPVNQVSRAVADCVRRAMEGAAGIGERKEARNEISYRPLDATRNDSRRNPYEAIQDYPPLKGGSSLEPAGDLHEKTGVRLPSPEQTKELCIWLLKQCGLLFRKDLVSALFTVFNLPNRTPSAPIGPLGNDKGSVSGETRGSDLSDGHSGENLIYNRADLADIQLPDLLAATIINVVSERDGQPAPSENALLEDCIEPDPAQSEKSAQGRKRLKPNVGIHTFHLLTYTIYYLCPTSMNDATNGAPLNAIGYERGMRASYQLSISDTTVDKRDATIHPLLKEALSRVEEQYRKIIHAPTRKSVDEPVFQLLAAAIRRLRKQYGGLKPEFVL